MLSQSSRGPSQPHGSCRNSPLGSTGLSCGAGAGRAESQEQKLRGGEAETCWVCSTGESQPQHILKNVPKMSSAARCRAGHWHGEPQELSRRSPRRVTTPPPTWVTLPARGLAAFWGPGGDSGSHRCLSQGHWAKGPCGFSPPQAPAASRGRAVPAGQRQPRDA